MNMSTQIQALKLAAIAVLISTALPVLLQLAVVVAPSAASVA
jgi:hypothetical protein